MSTTSRNSILARLRAQSGPERAQLEERASTNEAPQSCGAMPMQIKEALSANRAEVIITSKSELANTLKELCERERWQHVMSTANAFWNTPLKNALKDANLCVHEYDQPFEALKPALFEQMDAGITTVNGVILETGTLVLIPDQDTPRTLSLVPPVHIAIVDENCPAYQSLAQCMTHASWQSDAMPSNIVFVSGPSKTADIQQTLAYGAHGPKRLIAIVLQESP
ncbi:MAG: lactate utilization protein C [Oleiphilaceae bacterium]|nr:lactate utilization protein C [Oleiphilaceae bacterium]